jgi:flagellar biosynthesis protein FlhF
MQLETIQASTLNEAMREVKRRFGSDAVVLSTRTIKQRRWYLFGKREFVEVTAGRGEDVPRRMPPAPVMRTTPHARAEYAANSKSAPKSTATAATAQQPKALLDSPAVQSVTMLNLGKEISTLNDQIQKLVHEVRHRTSPNVPENLSDHYRALLESEVSDEMATDILRTIQQQGKPEQIANPSWVRERIIEQIERFIPVSGPIERKKTSGPHTVALIGPTGVGKTTTIAKLAANLKLRDHRKVGMITMDTYRIGAIDQLRKYTDLIRVPLVVVNSPEEMEAAIAGFADCEYVLIDTAGRSPNDTLKLSELSQFLEGAKPDEVHLVLSATCGPRAIELAIERFSAVRVDKMIFTKIDEAAQLGVILSAVRKVNKGLSYVTNGQDVPKDIEVGQARDLARRILGLK